VADHTYTPDWREVVVYSAPGPAPRLLVDEPELRVLVAGLEPGARIPPHAGPRGVYHALAGDGVFHLDGEALPFAAGAIIVASAGAVRGIEAASRLAFLAVRIGGEPDTAA
jgi:quercetin dioxygenase-like cupin family protein